MSRWLLVLGFSFLVFSGCRASKGKYGPSAQALTPAVSFGGIWDDPIRCAEQVAGGRRLKLAAGKLRVGTWNIRWFPDGVPGVAPQRLRHPTNIKWLACAIAYINVDVLGLQEIKLTERGRAGLETLGRELSRLTGAPWQWVEDGCPAGDRQHLLLLYRSDRVELSDLVSHGELDASAKAGGDPGCPGVLRPGLGAYFRSKQGGIDFHFVSTHLDSGQQKLDFRNRRVAWEGIEKVRQRRSELVADDDFIIAADFNLMGCPDCGLPHSWAELAVLRKELGKLDAPLNVARLSHRCTQYTKGVGTVIDAIAAAGAMREAEGAEARVTGVCAASKCEGVPARSIPFLLYISDHCPVVMDLVDQDLDDPALP